MGDGLSDSAKYGRALKAKESQLEVQQPKTFLLGEDRDGNVHLMTRLIDERTLCGIPIDADIDCPKDAPPEWLYINPTQAEKVTCPQCERLIEFVAGYLLPEYEELKSAVKRLTSNILSEDMDPSES